MIISQIVKPSKTVTPLEYDPNHNLLSSSAETAVVLFITSPSSQSSSSKEKSWIFTFTTPPVVATQQ